MVDGWGGWKLFQELLSILNRIAQKYNGIANVATRYILDKSAVAAAVIIGVIPYISYIATSKFESYT
jgi:hypothetical protein